MSLRSLLHSTFRDEALGRFVSTKNLLEELLDGLVDWQYRLRLLELHYRSIHWLGRETISCRCEAITVDYSCQVTDEVVPHRREKVAAPSCLRVGKKTQRGTRDVGHDFTVKKGNLVV